MRGRGRQGRVRARVAVVCALATAMLPVATANAATPTVTFAFVGDTILGNTPRLPAAPDQYLSPIAPALRNRVDVAFGNLEGTLTTYGTSKCRTSSTTCYAFRNPPSYSRYLAAAGFDVLSLANNHSYDFGSTGLRSTQDAIRTAGMLSTGMPGQITYLTRNSVRIAVVAFAPYGLTNNLLQLDNAARLIRVARAHAPVVVVYMHAGAEGSWASHVTGREEYYVGEDRGNPRRFAHLAVDNGATLVVASGPHVLRGMEFYKRRLIAYSLGDFANYRNFSTAGVLARSAVLHVTVGSTGGFLRAHIASVHLAPEGRAWPGGDSVAFIADLSRHDFGLAAPVISASGGVYPR